MPLFCGVCGHAMLMGDDVISYDSNECCFLCSLKWYDTHQKDWQEGWRPSQQQVHAENKKRQIRKKVIKLSV